MASVHLSLVLHHIFCIQFLKQLALISYKDLVPFINEEMHSQEPSSLNKENKWAHMSGAGVHQFFFFEGNVFASHSGKKKSGDKKSST